MKYIKKPVEVEAWQFTKENYKKGLPDNFVCRKISLFSQYGGDVIFGEIETLEGVMTISENDYIIKGIEGEFYPCKKEIFDKTYEVKK